MTEIRYTYDCIYTIRLYISYWNDFCAVDRGAAQLPSPGAPLHRGGRGPQWGDEPGRVPHLAAEALGAEAFHFIELNIIKKYFCLYMCIYMCKYIHIYVQYVCICYVCICIYAPASLLPWAWSWFAPPPCGPVVRVDWCECWLMES